MQRWPYAAPALVLLAWASQADADSRERAVPLPASYRAECAACHVAYPPGLLPAASWQRLMGNLGNHFGADASVDAATAAQLGAWLTANAASGRRAAGVPPEDRITRTQWFVRKHHEVTGSTWKLPAVKSAANCAACHQQADQGNYDEHAVRIPR